MAEIEVKDLSFSYDGKRDALSRMTFRIEPGESVGIVGANGAGKSTFLRLVVGLLDGYRGTLEVNGWPLERTHYARIRERVGYVFQDSESQLFLSTVAEDVAFGPVQYGYPPDEVEARVTAALAAVRIEALRDRRIYQLSGGEKKLAAIATVLSLRPAILLFDEPTIALDPRNRRNLIRVMNAMPCTKVIASHDLDMILDTCSRTLIFESGRLIADAPTREALSDRALLEAHGLELPLSLEHGALSVEGRE
ncbi:MAG: ABC transporter ATP-binding protein [Kiritimatiellae bacterium]|nr:ABC transporter ATP-binding protein [Kiritimatiellia bacterium]